MKQESLEAVISQVRQSISFFVVDRQRPAVLSGLEAQSRRKEKVVGSEREGFVEDVCPYSKSFHFPKKRRVIERGSLIRHVAWINYLFLCRIVVGSSQMERWVRSLPGQVRE